MAAQTRPYFMTLDGVDYMVEATGPAQAVRHIVGAALTELRPARGVDVAAWTRAGKDIPIAGQKVAPTPAAEPAVVDETPEFSAGDAYAWLAEWSTEPTKKIETVWKRVVSTGVMNLSDFDTLRTAVPKLSEALVAAITPEGSPFIPVDAIRGQIEDAPMELIVVVGAIGEAKRAELFEPKADAESQ